MKRPYPRIIYEDELLIGIDKPSGWLSIPARNEPERKNIYRWLQSKYDEIYTVHRLDLETSGLMIFAKTPEAHKFLNTCFQNRNIEKQYVAFVLGRPHPKEATIDLPLNRMQNSPYKTIVDAKGKTASTTYKVNKQFGHYAKLIVDIRTGRTHQIRAHLSAMGYPLMVDPLYGGDEAFYVSSIKENFKLGKGQKERPLLDRVSLHAYRMSCPHPDEQENISLQVELPKDLKAVEKQLSKWDPDPLYSSS